STSTFHIYTISLHDALPISNYNIKLSKKYSPEYLTLDIICFLNQEDIKGSFKIVNSNYINEKITETKKGYSKEKLKLINYLTKRSEEHTSELQSRFDIVCRL